MRMAECRQSTPLMSLVSSGEAPVREGYVPMQGGPANLFQAHMRPPYGFLRREGLLAVSAPQAQLQAKLLTHSSHLSTYAA